MYYKLVFCVSFSALICSCSWTSEIFYFFGKHFSEKKINDQYFRFCKFKNAHGLGCRAAHRQLSLVV